MTTVLLLGSGGREHALGRALVADPSVQLHAAPGNPGLAGIGTLHAVDPSDPAAVVALARRIEADLVVVGAEAPLVAGVADAIREAGIDCFGPSAAAAELEGSKAFAKDVMRASGVPTADARVCATPDEVAAALDAYGPPYVVKNDGLAAGKGVVVTPDRAAALAHAEACGKVVIEEFLDGPEVSLFAICDGATAVPLLPAQDFKRVGDGDTGPNTGGMGAYCPLPWAPDGLVEEVMTRVIVPTLTEMRRRGTPFTGLLYAGLALTGRGVRVVEFNVRFGDPETQAVLARLTSSLPDLLHSAATGRLTEAPEPTWSEQAAVDVVLAAPGYPGAVTTGGLITGIEEAEALPGVHVLHAGTGLDDDGRLISAGGRVLSVVAVGDTVAAARESAYEGLSRIGLDGGQYRTDIAAGR